MQTLVSLETQYRRINANVFYRRTRGGGLTPVGPVGLRRRLRKRLRRRMWKAWG